MTDVTVHLVALPGADTEPDLSVLRAVLTPDELARADRFVPSARHARIEFVTGRATLRSLLSRAVDDRVEPAEWRFAANAWGRPELAGPVPTIARDLRFNVSHTRGLLAVALTRAPADVGVDVEYTARRTDPDRLASRYFAPAEVAALEALPDAEARRRRFFELWTLKEAYIKVRGRGLAIPLASFAYAFDAHGAPSLSFAADHDRGDPWHFHPQLHDAGPEHQLATCIYSVRAGVPSVRVTEAP